MSSQKDTVITIDFSRLFSSKYQKAVPGSFDESVFAEPATGKFRFPAYNPYFKGMISLRDETDYKQDYFTGLTIQQKQAFSIENFERKFRSPSFTIEKFSDFMDRIPEDCFDKGISKENVLYLFKKFQRFINEEEIEPYYFLDKEKSKDALRIGLLTAFNKSTIPLRELWDKVHTYTLQDVCKAENIAGTGKRATMLDLILERNPEFPHHVVVPSPLLKETYLSFADFYLDDIKHSIDRLHPLYLQDVWETVHGSNYGKSFKKRAQDIIDSRYWADRLTTITINDEDDE